MYSLTTFNLNSNEYLDMIKPPESVSGFRG